MPKGYQRIIDLSALSIKLLNDQLAQLWAKVMGGLEIRDLTPDTRAALNTVASAEGVSELTGKMAQLTTQVQQTAAQIALKADAGAIASLILQNADAIRLSVGRIAGENLVRNGGAGFQLTAWRAFSGGAAAAETDGSLGHSCFLVSAADGGICQEGLNLRAESPYTLSALVHVLSGQARLEAWDAAGALVSAGAWLPSGEGYVHTLLTLPPDSSGRRIALALRVQGQARFSDVQAEEGAAATGWRPNSGELGNAGVSISEAGVRIDARNFELVLSDESGSQTMQMKAGVQGFADLYVAENLFLRGRPMYLGPGEYCLFVHPNAPDASGAWRFDHTPPADLGECFRDVQTALDFIPKWCDADVSVHIYGQDGAAYPGANLSARSFFGGGTIRLTAWTAASPNWAVAALRVSNNALPVTVERCTINASSYADGFVVTQAFAQFLGCKVNGRGNLIASGGFTVSMNGAISLSGCEAHNCRYGLLAQSGGQAYAEGCAGGGNDYGAAALNGGLIQHNAQASGFRGTLANTIEMNGKILSLPASYAAGALPPATPAEQSARFPAADTRSYQEGIGWRQEAHLLQGEEGGAGCLYGLLWLDRGGVAAALSGRTLKTARLTLKRRAVGGDPTPVGARLRGFANQSPQGAPALCADYGDIGAWARGEARGAAVPLSAIADLAAGRVQALGFFDESGRTLGFEGTGAAGAPILDITYQ